MNTPDSATTMPVIYLGNRHSVVDKMRKTEQPSCRTRKYLCVCVFI